MWRGRRRWRQFKERWQRKTATGPHGVHVRTAGGAGEQVQDHAVPVGVRAAEPRAVAVAHRDPGENMVPEQADQVEEAEPRAGREQPDGAAPGAARAVGYRRAAVLPPARLFGRAPLPDAKLLGRRGRRLLSPPGRPSLHHWRTPSAVVMQPTVAAQKSIASLRSQSPRRERHSDNNNNKLYCYYHDATIIIIRTNIIFNIVIIVVHQVTAPRVSCKVVM